jgi:streptogrisin C
MGTIKQRRSARAIAAVLPLLALSQVTGLEPSAGALKEKDRQGQLVLQPNSILVRSGAADVQPTSAELEDLAVIAGEEDIPIQTAIDRYSWQRVFEEAVQSIRAAYPATYAGSAMNPDADAISAVVFMTGTVPTDISNYLSEVPVPVEVHGNRPYSEVQIQSSVRSAHNIVRESRPGVSVSTEFDESLGVIIAEVYASVPLTGSPSNSEPVAPPSDTTFELPVDDSQPVQVSVHYALPSGVGEDVTTIRGGQALFWPGTTSLACTSAFPVASTSSATEGLMTADHCANDLNYLTHDVLTYRRSLPLNHGDIQYMSSSSEVGHSFYYDVNGALRDIDALGTPTQDQTLCKFGENTGQTCDQVRDTFTCRDNYCNLVSMDNREAGAGDSGGPWYYGSAAYGVHSGYHTSWFQKRDQWTPVYNTLGDLSLNIKMGRQ